MLGPLKRAVRAASDALFGLSTTVEELNKRLRDGFNLDHDDDSFVAGVIEETTPAGNGRKKKKAAKR